MNGGIDLTLEPERIVEISEATNFPELLKFIYELNTTSSPFITLGCEAGFDDAAFVGYIELSFKSETAANNLLFIQNLDQEFYAWLLNQHPEIFESVKASLVWEYSSYLYREISERMKISIYYRATYQQAAGQLLDFVRHYLLKICSCPP